MTYTLSLKDVSRANAFSENKSFGDFFSVAVCRNVKREKSVRRRNKKKTGTPQYSYANLTAIETIKSDTLTVLNFIREQLKM